MLAHCRFQVVIFRVIIKNYSKRLKKDLNGRPKRERERERERREKNLHPLNTTCTQLARRVSISILLARGFTAKGSLLSNILDSEFNIDKFVNSCLNRLLLWKGHLYSTPQAKPEFAVDLIDLKALRHSSSHHCLNNSWSQNNSWNFSKDIRCGIAPCFF